MILVGRVLRGHSSRDQEQLLHMIRNATGITQSSRARISRPSTGVESPPMDSTSERMPFDVQNDDDDQDVWKYTSALKEKGDRHGFVPAYNIQRVSLTPSVFKAVVSVQGYVFEGRGRSKQQAKHMASREACTALGIDMF